MKNLIELIRLHLIKKIAGNHAVIMNLRIGISEEITIRPERDDLTVFACDVAVYPNLQCEPEEPKNYLWAQDQPQ